MVMQTFQNLNDLYNPTSSFAASSPSILLFSSLLSPILTILTVFNEQPAAMSRQRSPTHVAIPPQGPEHTHTLILLHERGDNFVNFGHSFLNQGLHIRLLTVRFVIPATPKSTASEATLAISQGIDNWLQGYLVKDPTRRSDEHKTVLCQAAECIRAIMHEEARILGEDGYQRIVLWGEGEGCAAGMFTLISGWHNLHESCDLGAFVGLSGWLPRGKELEAIYRGDDTSTSDEGLNATNIHDRSNKPQDKSTFKLDGRASSSKEAGLTCEVHEDGFLSEMYDLTKGALYPSEMIPTFIKPLIVRDLLDLPLLSLDEYLTDEKLRLSSCYHFHTPVFLGRSLTDFQFSHKNQSQLSLVLSIALIMDVTWEKWERSYDWSDQLRQILRFLEARVDLPKAMLSSS